MLVHVPRITEAVKCQEDHPHQVVQPREFNVGSWTQRHGRVEVGSGRNEEARD